MRVPYSPFFLQQVRDGQGRRTSRRRGPRSRARSREARATRDSKPTTGSGRRFPPSPTTRRSRSCSRARASSSTRSRSKPGRPGGRACCSFFGPTLLFVGLLFFLMRRAGNVQNILGAFGRSRASRYQPSGDRVTFKDVAGIDEAKDGALRGRRLPSPPGEVPQARRADPARRAARRPAGHRQDAARTRGRRRGGRAVLLDGGVRVRRGDRRRGRLARARSVRPGQGGGAGDRLHRRARRHRAVAHVRVAGFSGGNDEREQTLNQILTEMDGFDSVDERDRDRRDQPAGRARPGAAPPGPLRPPRLRAAARPRRAVRRS